MYFDKKEGFSLKNNFKNDPLFWIGLSPLLPALLISMVVLFLFKSLPDKLPLFYSFTWGPNQLASHREFFLLPLTVAVITLVNLFLSRQLHQSQYFFKLILTATSLMISLILTITFVKIVLIFI